MSDGGTLWINPNWGTSSATTWSSGSTYTITTNTAEPMRARVVLDDVPIHPPAPTTEVERLLGEVEAVCAMAR